MNKIQHVEALASELQFKPIMDDYSPVVDNTDICSRMRVQQNGWEDLN